jgi:hypothetical protein
MKKKGISSILFLALFLAILIVSIGTIWTTIRDSVSKGGEEIQIRSQLLQTKFSILLPVEINEQTNISFLLKRESGGEILVFPYLVFEDSSGDTTLVSSYSSSSVSELERIQVSLIYSELNLQDISVIRVYSATLDSEGSIVISNVQSDSYKVSEQQEQPIDDIIQPPADSGIIGSEDNPGINP